MSSKSRMVDSILAELETTHQANSPISLNAQIRNRMDAEDLKYRINKGWAQLRPILAGGLLILNAVIYYPAIRQNSDQTKIRSALIDKIAAEYTLTLDNNPFQFKN